MAPPRRRARALALAASLAVAPLHAASSHAQQSLPSRFAGAMRASAAGRALPSSSGTIPDPSRGRERAGPWWAPLASAALPGSGQALQRRGRAIPYLAAEAFLVAQYLDARNEGRQRRGQYRSLARVARSPYGGTFPVGGFEYYESMEHFVESGVYDSDPGGDLAPELDTTTFNGSTWRLARQTFWEDPDVPPPRSSPAYQNALDFYTRRAVRPEFRWSWRNAQLEQDLFRRTVQGSNNAFRLSSQYLGVLIANHALSAVDAFVQLRLTRRVTAQQTWELDGSVPWAPLGRPRRHGPR